MVNHNIEGSSGVFVLLQCLSLDQWLVVRSYYDYRLARENLRNISIVHSHAWEKFWWIQSFKRQCPLPKIGLKTSAYKMPLSRLSLSELACFCLGLAKKPNPERWRGLTSRDRGKIPHVFLVGETFLAVKLTKAMLQDFTRTQLIDKNGYWM